MITKIELKNVASYWNSSTELITDKRINLIYGLNWTWKTTISRYLQDKDNSKFSDCNIVWHNWEKILVYNQDFIKDIFYEKNNYPWIFSLWTWNKKAKQGIENAKNEIKKLELQLLNIENGGWLTKELEDKEAEIGKLDEESKEFFWKIKDKYDNTSELSFCLEWYKSDKKKLRDYLLSLEYMKNIPKLENIVKEANEILDDNATKIDENLITKINFNFWNIEWDKIFTTAIVWNKDSQISEFIEQYQNSDWIKKWFDNYIIEPNWSENEICPFCHEKTISQDFYNKLKEYFDILYQNKINQINILGKKYLEEYDKIKNLDEVLLEIWFIKANEKNFRLLFKNIITIIDNNLQKIEEKKTYPSNIVNLQSSETEREKFNNFLNNILGEIKSFNERIENKKKVKESIKNDFWKIMRNQYNDEIKLYKKNLIKLKQEKQKINVKISEIKRKINVQENIIRKNQKDIETIQEAIDNINNQLLYFWINWFKIVKSDSGSEEYKIQRGTETDTDFLSLSEWEKTVISFLYFIELCKWRQSKQEVLTKKIVVIDDPISSLSHMFVFNVAQTIKQQIFDDNNFEQIFVLTHNLYFFHELILNLNKSQKSNFLIFRITKGRTSSINPMKQNEIKNDYESYWEIIKENNNDNSKYTPILANTMRNILEYFFCFVLDSDNLNNAIQEVNKEQKYQHFVRYIQRESHSDAINISDMKEIDTNIFQEAFKKIFYDAWYEKHYEKMMK